MSLIEHAGRLAVGEMMKPKNLLPERCGMCPNCVDLERVRKRVLACVNPPFSSADNDIVALWNAELRRLPCLGNSGADDAGVKIGE